MVIALLPSQSAVEGPVTACRPWTRRSPPPPDRGSTSGAGSEDVLVVDRGCHAKHAAGDAIAVRSPLELGDLAALESACLRATAAKANTLYRIILRGSTKQHDDGVRWDGPRSAGPKNALS